MNQFIEEILSNPIIRTFIEGLILKIVGNTIAEILHRRSTDPEYLKNSDAAFSAMASAKTDEEKQNATIAIQRLISSR